MPYADAILAMIQEVRQNALQSVNAELIRLYWKVGKYLSSEAAKASYGDALIDATATSKNTRQGYGASIGAAFIG